MIQPTPLTEFIKDIMGILDADQMQWVEANKGYYIFKEQTQTKELKAKLCTCPTPKQI